MLFNVKVYQVGDIYGVPKLKYRAKKKFEDIIRSCWQANDFHTTVTEVYSSSSGDSKPTYRCPNCYQQWQFGITGSPYYYYCPFCAYEMGDWGEYIV